MKYTCGSSLISSVLVERERRASPSSEPERGAHHADHEPCTRKIRRIDAAGIPIA